MRRVAILAALSLAACTTTGKRVPPAVAAPPARYQAPASGIVKTMDPADVARECHSLEALMCAKGAFIFAPFPWLYPDDPYAIALWHELAHVLGWPADHPAR